MYYLVYRVVNLVDGKIYTGCHKTLDKDDGYMGSGTFLKRAQKKYGIGSFRKDILFEASSSEEMFAKEKELVTRGPESYNLTDGGLGCLGLSLESRRKISDSLKTREHTEASKRKRSIAMIGRKLGPASLERRQKISKARIGRKFSPLTEVHRNKISSAKCGKPRKSGPLTQEHRMNIAMARLGKKYGPYGKQKNLIH